MIPPSISTPLINTSLGPGDSESLLLRLFVDTYTIDEHTD